MYYNPRQFAVAPLFVMMLDSTTSQLMTLTFSIVEDVPIVVDIHTSDCSAVPLLRY